MKWYLWVIVGILALNGLLIALIALALVFDKIRKRRSLGANGNDSGAGGGSQPKPN